MPNALWLKVILNDKISKDDIKNIVFKAKQLIIHNIILNSVLQLLITDTMYSNTMFSYYLYIVRMLLNEI